MLSMTLADEEQIREIAERCYPHECCGFLVGLVEGDNREVLEVREADNTRTDSLRNRFLISPDEFLRVERSLLNREEEILGFFHSHPDSPARPSDYDIDHAWPWYSYVIVEVSEGRSRAFTNWRLKEDRSSFVPEAVLVDGAEIDSGTK